MSHSSPSVPEGGGDLYSDRPFLLPPALHRRSSASRSDNAEQIHRAASGSQRGRCRGGSPSPDRYRRSRASAETDSARALAKEAYSSPNVTRASFQCQDQNKYATTRTSTHVEQFH